MERGLREVVTTPPMSDQRPKRDTVSIEEVTVSQAISARIKESD